MKTIKQIRQTFKPTIDRLSGQAASIWKDLKNKTVGKAPDEKNAKIILDQKIKHKLEKICTGLVTDEVIDAKTKLIDDQINHIRQEFDLADQSSVTRFRLSEILTIKNEIKRIISVSHHQAIDQTIQMDENLRHLIGWIRIFNGRHKGNNTRSESGKEKLKYCQELKEIKQYLYANQEIPWLYFVSQMDKFCDQHNLTAAGVQMAAARDIYKQTDWTNFNWKKLNRRFYSWRSENQLIFMKAARRYYWICLNRQISDQVNEKFDWIHRFRQIMPEADN